MARLLQAFYESNRKVEWWNLIFFLSDVSMNFKCNENLLHYTAGEAILELFFSINDVCFLQNLEK